MFLAEAIGFRRRSLVDRSRTGSYLIVSQLATSRLTLKGSLFQFGQQLLIWTLQRPLVGDYH